MTFLDITCVYSPLFEFRLIVCLIYRGFLSYSIFLSCTHGHLAVRVLWRDTPTVTLDIRWIEYALLTSVWHWKKDFNVLTWNIDWITQVSQDIFIISHVWNKRKKIYLLRHSLDLGYSHQSLQTLKLSLTCNKLNVSGYSI